MFGFAKAFTLVFSLVTNNDHSMITEPKIGHYSSKETCEIAGREIDDEMRRYGLVYVVWFCVPAPE